MLLSGACRFLAGIRSSAVNPSEPGSLMDSTMTAWLLVADDELNRSLFRRCLQASMASC